MSNEEERHMATEDESEPTALEVYENIRRYVMKTHEDTKGKSRNQDQVWARGGRFVIDRADAALREAGVDLADLPGAPSTTDIVPTTVGSNDD